MGKILRIERLFTGKEHIHQSLKAVIEEDANSRRDEEDMYRGDFGSSTYNEHPTHVYKGKAESVRDKNFYHFEEVTDFENYVIDYAIIGQLGYIAHHAKPELWVKGARGPFKVGKRKFDNVTELREAIKRPSIGKELYSETIYQAHTLRPIGKVSSECRQYKSKPKTLPKKYQWLDEYVEVAYGGWNPY